MLFESDYPHQDSTWPHTRKMAQEMTRGMDPEVVRKIMRGNAIRLYDLGSAASSRAGGRAGRQRAPTSSTRPTSARSGAAP